MTTISSSIRTRDIDRDGYSKDEIDAMKKDESTSSVLNRVRRDVGLRGPDVTVRGDDKSNPELKKAWASHDVPHAAVDTVVHAVVHGAEATLLEAAVPVLFAYTAGQNYIESKERGKDLQVNAERAAMHIALINAIDLPQGYRNVEQGRWRDVGTGFASGAFKLVERFETTARKEAAILQLHADRGMSAARDLIGARLIGDDYDPAELAKALAMAPDIKAKYDADPAYRAGFDAIVWAKQHDSAAYADTLKKLEARDVRYAQASISYRG